MVVCDEPIRPLPYVGNPLQDLLKDLEGLAALEKNKYALFGAAWERNDRDDLPNRHMFMGISLHLSEEQYQAFHGELYASYDRRFGVNAVPDTYWATKGHFECTASEGFYRFLQESTGNSRKGVVVGIHNLKYLRRLGLVEPSRDIQNFLKKYGKGFKEDFMTVNKVLEEINDDTNLYYLGLND